MAASLDGAHRRQACNEFGENYEQRFEQIMLQLGCEVRKADDTQNKHHKIDQLWRPAGQETWNSADVKSPKPGGVIVEAVGVSGFPGWLHGRATHLAFFIDEKTFYLVEREPFAEFVYTQVGPIPDHPQVGRAADLCPYSWIQRPGRKDVFARTPGIYERFEEYARGIGQDWWIIKLS